MLSACAIDHLYISDEIIPHIAPVIAEGADIIKVSLLHSESQIIGVVIGEAEPIPTAASATVSARAGPASALVRITAT